MKEKTLYEHSNDYMVEVGEFILEFSHLEFELGSLIHHLESGNKKVRMVPFIYGDDLNGKRKEVRKLLKGHSELIKLWDRINTQISHCNEFRNLLVHGLTNKVVPNPNLKFLRQHNKKFLFKEISIDDIIEHRKILIDLKTGKIGLLGTFTEMCLQSGLIK